MADDVGDLNRMRALADVRNSPGFRLLLEEIDKLAAGSISTLQTGKDMETLALGAAEFRAYLKCKSVIDSATRDASAKVQRAFSQDPALALQCGGVAPDKHY